MPFDLSLKKKQTAQKSFFIKKCLFVLTMGLYGVFFGETALAADVFFSPSSGVFTGETMSVDVLVDTQDIAVNNAEIVLRYPNDLLEIISTSASDSVFSLWVGAPQYSNETGTLAFTAGIPTPGFTGDAGKILSIVFRVKGSGKAVLTYSSAIIRANDGYGSNVFHTGAKATFELTPEPRIGQSRDFDSTALEPPVFTTYPTEIEAGRQIIVLGTAHPERTVNLWLQKDREDQQSFTLQSDRDGRFSFFLNERTKEGVYRLWGEVSDDHGLRSEPSAKIAIVAVGKSINIWIVVLSLLSLVFLFGVGYAWRSYRLSKNRLRKEALEAETSLHQAFGSLRENRDRLEMFEAARTKRQLTKEEEKIVAWLKQDLNNAEESVEKEIEDIEKETK